MMITCKSITLLVFHPEMGCRRLSAWKLLTNLEEPKVSWEGTWEGTWKGSWPLRSSVNTQGISKASGLGRNANRAVGSQKHLEAQGIPQSSGPVSVLQQISISQQREQIQIYPWFIYMIGNSGMYNAWSPHPCRQGFVQDMYFGP